MPTSTSLTTDRRQTFTALSPATPCGPLNATETSTVLKLLEMQRNAMLMYTSCGWFFDDLSGIETVQILQFAGRVVQLAENVFGHALEDQFVRRLAAAKSNLPEQGNGSQIYERWSGRPKSIGKTSAPITR